MGGRVGGWAGGSQMAGGRWEAGGGSVVATHIRCQLPCYLTPPPSPMLTHVWADASSPLPSPCN